MQTTESFYFMRGNESKIFTLCGSQGGEVVEVGVGVGVGVDVVDVIGAYSQMA